MADLCTCLLESVASKELIPGTMCLAHNAPWRYLKLGPNFSIFKFSRGLGEYNTEYWYIHRSPQADDLVPQVLASCLDDLYQTNPIVLLLCALPYILFCVHIIAAWRFFLSEWKDYKRVTGITGQDILDELWSCMKGDLQTMLIHHITKSCVVQVALLNWWW